jgi:hypothetical protein
MDLVEVLNFLFQLGSLELGEVRKQLESIGSCIHMRVIRIIQLKL